MRLAVFVLILIGCVIAVAIWSFAMGAGLGSTVLRIVIVAVALQAAYFILLLLSALLPKSAGKGAEKLKQASRGKAAKTGLQAKVTGVQK